MKLGKRIDAFIKLGNAMQENIEKLKQGNQNLWFTDENIEYAVNEIASSLNRKDLENWLSQYPETGKELSTKRIGIITAGNIPLVGFHDFLSVLISGNICKVKLSSKDNILLLHIIKMLTDIEPEFKDYISYSEDRLTDFDAVIATGSNNSARYFNYYFGKYPHIIRKNRNSAAIISGHESDEELELLADDIFMYFGLGCRSVSKLFLPDKYDLNNIFKHSLKYKHIINHNKYANNYDYNRTIYLLNQIKFKDNGVMLLKEDLSYSSPISVVFYENYLNIETVEKRLTTDKELIQCVVSGNGIIEGSIPFGKSQKPDLWDYADNIDTMNFLINL